MMKETAADQSVKEQAYRVTGEELRQFIERAERLEAEKKDIAEQVKEVFAEAKSRGYNVPTIKKLIAMRKKDADDLAEERAVLEMYAEAMGVML